MDVSERMSFYRGKSHGYTSDLYVGVVMKYVTQLFVCYLQVLNAELVPVHIDSREEDGLHLVVS